MKRRQVISIIAIVATASLALAADSGPHHAGGQQAASLTQVQAKILPMSLKSLEAITQATQSGDKASALKELAHLEAMLKQIQAALAKELGPQFANTKCPIMGHPINPKNVPDNLIREYKGQKVGFCCAGCPERWDALSEAQKEAKLKAHAAPAFINASCPIMGSPINLAKVPSHLVRDYKGQKVAFCCAGCPAQWDRLSNSQKQAKLAKVKAPPVH